MDLLSDLKNALYQDKVYSALQLLGMRKSEQTSVTDLRISELRVFSQNGEDGVIDAIARTIPDMSRIFVEFGVGDGWSCNCRLLAEVFGWSGLFLETNSKDFDSLRTRYVNNSGVQCKRLFVNPSNVNEIFRASGIPSRFGVLSIDIDGQDYWVWEALDDFYQPDIVCIEINSGLGARAVVEQKSSSLYPALTNTWGASLSAISALGASKGYTLVHCELAGVNAFLVKNEILSTNQQTYKGTTERSPNYGLRGRAHDNEVLFPNGEKLDRPQFWLNNQ